MNKHKLLFLMIFAIPMGLAHADICTDLSKAYHDRIRRLEQETLTAISLTTDEAERAAIRDSFEMQKAQLETERDSVLASAGCGTTTPTPDPDPTPNPGTDPTPNPDPNPNPTPTPDDGGETPPNPNPDPTPTPDDDGETPPNPDDDDDSDNQACKELMDRIKAEAVIKCSGKGFSEKAKYIHAHRAEIQAVCGNYGKGRRHGNDHHKYDDDKKKHGSDRDKKDYQIKQSKEHRKYRHHSLRVK